MTPRNSRQYRLSMFISNSLFLLALLFYGASQIFYFYSYYRKLSPGTFLGHLVFPSSNLRQVFRADYQQYLHGVSDCSHNLEFYPWSESTIGSG